MSDPNDKCRNCGKPLVYTSEGTAYDPITKYPARRGWTGALYCSRSCDEAGYMEIHSDMPGAGRCDRVPAHERAAMDRRWNQ